jgi:hypothetical protein
VDGNAIVNCVSSTCALPQPGSTGLRGRDLLALCGETIVRHSPAMLRIAALLISNRGRGMRQVLLAWPEEAIWQGPRGNPPFACCSSTTTR